MFYFFDYGSRTGTTTAAGRTDYEIIISYTGVVQGCVLGSFLFALGLSDQFRHLVRFYGQCVVFWYIDDVYLCGPAVSAREYLTDIRQHGARIGYELNYKTELALVA